MAHDKEPHHSIFRSAGNDEITDVHCVSWLQASCASRKRTRADCDSAWPFRASHELNRCGIPACQHLSSQEKASHGTAGHS